MLKVYKRSFKEPFESILYSVYLILGEYFDPSNVEVEKNGYHTNKLCNPDSIMPYLFKIVSFCWCKSSKEFIFNKLVK